MPADKHAPCFCGECLVFFIYRAEHDQRVRNAIVRFSGRIKCYGGQRLGISTQVEVVKAPEDSIWAKRNDWCISMLGFPTQDAARLWYVSEPEIKQHDFPPPSDGFLMFSVKVRYPPVSDCLTFCWTEFANIRSKGSFQRDFIDKVTTLMDTHQVDHGLVFVKDKNDLQLDRLRDCWLPHDSHYRLDMYKSAEAFRVFNDLETCKNLLQTRDELCDTTQIMFTIDPKIS